jgi:hypothetical protein
MQKTGNRSHDVLLEQKQSNLNLITPNLDTDLPEREHRITLNDTMKMQPAEYRM